MAYGIVNVKGAAGTSSSGVFLPDVSNITITGGDGIVSIKWTDPENVVVSGITMATWAGTLLVRKVGSVPTSQTDGTVVINSTVKNSHSTAAFIDNTVVNGTQYFYRFFPYSADGNYTGGSAATAKPSNTVVPIPSINSTHTYNGIYQTPTMTGFDSNIMSKTGNLSEINANESTSDPYEIWISLTDPDVIWADGTYTNKVLTWNIYKADNIPTLSKSTMKLNVGESDTFVASALGDGIISMSSINTDTVVVSAPQSASSSTAVVTATGGGGTVVAVRVSEGTNYKAGIAYCNVNVVKKRIPIPIVSNTTKTYNGEEQHPTVEGEPAVAYATRSGTYAATNASAVPYTVTYTLTDSALFEWEDGTIAPKVFNWSINQAVNDLHFESDTAVVNNDSISSEVAVAIINPSGGELSVTSNSSDTIVTASINGSSLVLTKTNNAGGTAVITVASAATTNYLAAITQITVTVHHYRKMTVKIDQSNSNPYTSCTYDDDAVGMTPKSADWDEFFGHYPCMFQDGVEGVKLDPSNFAKDLEGNTVDITNGTAGDVMIAFPRRGLNMSTSGNIVTITMTDNPNDPDFEYMAHKRGDTVKEKFYIGAYMGSTATRNSKTCLCSLSGKGIAVNATIGTFRTNARNNGEPDNNGGSGYDQHSWYPLVFLQCMWVLKYKTLNSQDSTYGLGRGFVDGNSGQKATGGTETKGMDWGEKTGKDHMKVFGIEDLWGNVWSWIDGMATDGSRCIWTATQGFNDSRTGYTQRSQSIVGSDKSGYFDKVVGDTHCGFTPKSWSGSETTYYSDRSVLYASRFLLFGELWAYGSYAGMFYLNVNHDASTANSTVGSRLMFL